MAAATTRATVAAAVATTTTTTAAAAATAKVVGIDNNQLKAAAKETAATAIGGPHEKMSFFQIASGPILSIPIHLKTCLYGPCKFSLKKNDPFLTYERPKVSIFCH
jgi:hypothetical protein